MCCNLHLSLFCSKFWCRNRPGDEMKDKYNMAANPLVYQGDASDMNGTYECWVYAASHLCR